MKKGILWLSLMFVFSCAHKEESMLEVEYPSQLTGARRSMEKGDHLKAETQIKNYLDNPQDLYFVGPAYLLLAENREVSGQQESAIEAYQQAITQGAGYDNKVLTQAIYKLSWIYEKQKDYEKMLIALNDLSNNISVKDAFIKDIEIPSRVANAYFVLGSLDKAMEARAKVTSESLKIYESRSEMQEPLIQALMYRSLMALPLPEPMPLQESEYLPLLQKDILDLAEKADLKRADMAFDHLEKLYQKQWQQLKSTLQQKKKVKLVEKMQKNKEALEQMSKFKDQMDELRAARRPLELTTHPHLNKEFFQKLDLLEKEVRQAIQKLELGVQKSKAL